MVCWALALAPGRMLSSIVVDATQSVRGLYGFLQLQELGLPLVLAVTMADEAGSATPDVRTLSEKLGVPVVVTDAHAGEGLPGLDKAIVTVGFGHVTPANQEHHRRLQPLWRWQPAPPLAAALDRIVAAFPGAPSGSTDERETWPRSRALGLWALLSLNRDDELRNIPDAVRTKVHEEANADLQALDTQAAQGRYAFLDREVAPLVKAPLSADTATPSTASWSAQKRVYPSF